MAAMKKEQNSLNTGFMTLPPQVLHVIIRRRLNIISGCITSLLIAIQDFLVSGFRCQVSANSFLTPDT